MRDVIACSLVVIAGIVQADEPANEIGVYFDEAGTVSHRVLDLSSFEERIVRVYVVLKNATTGVHAFNYQFVGSYSGLNVAFIQNTFLSGRNCSGFGHCDLNYWYVTAHGCPCVEGSSIVLQTLVLFVPSSVGTLTLDIEPTTCVVWPGFSFAPCDCSSEACTIPLTRAADSAATLSWGVVAVRNTSFGRLKSLYE